MALPLLFSVKIPAALFARRVSFVYLFCSTGVPQ